MHGVNSLINPHIKRAALDRVNSFFMDALYELAALKNNNMFTLTQVRGDDGSCVLERIVALCLAHDSGLEMYIYL